MLCRSLLLFWLVISILIPFGNLHADDVLDFIDSQSLWLTDQPSSDSKAFQPTLRPWQESCVRN